MKIIGQIPNRCFLAFSGGGDSCAALAFLLNGRKDVRLLHYNHGTEHALEAEAFTRRVSRELGVKSYIGNIKHFREKEQRESKEEYWRNARYSFFGKYHGRKIITVHHLDDCIESWIFGALHGTPKLIPYTRDDVGDGIIRPFLSASRQELISFLLRREPSILHEWVDDPSNEDTRYMRNLIRHEMVPTALKVNPGLHKVIRKKILQESRRKGR